MRRLWVGLVAGLLFAGLGGADTVFLKNGRTIKGKIVSENEREIVLRTPGGRVPLPRKLIKRIERTSAGRTALDMGLLRAREGDYDRAREQFRLALNDPDPEVANRARAELDSLPAASGPSPRGPARKVAKGWPPGKDQPFPVEGFLDEFGRPISARSLRGKVVLFEVAGMHHPFSQAFSGADEKGGFRGVTPQPDVGSLQKQLARHAGVPPTHSDLMIVQLLIAGPDGKTPPTAKQAGEWAAHFGHTQPANVHLWLGAPQHLKGGSEMFGMFMLMSPDGVVRLRSRNYPQLLPYIKRFVDAKQQPKAKPATPQAGQQGARAADDYRHARFTNIYPESLESPPPEAPYPKAIVPLPNPRSLGDVPTKYRQFVNHSMSYVAKAALAKANAIAALKRGGDVSQAQATYKREMGALWRAVQSLPRLQEQEMASARSSLISAFVTQRDLFEKAFTEVGQGKTTYAKVRGWKEATEQQSNLSAAAQLMQKRFDRLEPATRQSINTHLGALAGFPP